MNEQLELRTFERVAEELSLGVALIGPPPEFRIVFVNAFVRGLLGDPDVVGRRYADVWADSSEVGERMLERQFDESSSATHVTHRASLGLEHSDAHRIFDCTLSRVVFDGDPFVMATCADATSSHEAHEATRRELEASVILQETARLSLTSLKPDVLAQRLVADIHRRFELRTCNVWLVNETRDEIRQISQVGFVDKPQPVALTEESDAVTAVTTARTVVRRDTSAPDTPHVTRRIMSLLGAQARSLVALPLMDEDGAFGCLIMVWPAPRDFSTSEIALFEGIAAGLSLGLRNARLNQAAASDSAVMRGANEILEAGHLAETEQELGRACLRVAEDLTGSEFGFVGEVHEDGVLYEVSISDPGWDACAMVDADGHRRKPGRFGLVGLYGHVLSSGESILVNEPDEDPRHAGLPDGHPPLTSFIGVPFKRAGRIAGMIGLANRVGGYRDQDLELVEAIAPSIATALYSWRTKRDLAKTIQLLSAHVENSPLAVVEFDAEFNIVRWAGEAERVFGYARDEIVGRAIREMKWVYEEDIPLVERELQGFLDGSRSRSRKVNRNYRKDGRVIWCEWYSSATYDEQGKLISVLSLVLDITENRRLIDALIVSEKQANELITYAPTGIYEIDFRTGRFTRVNDAMVHLSGYSREELLDMDAFELLDEPSRRLFAERVQRTLAGEPVDDEVEYSVRRKDGECIFVVLNVRFTTDRDGKPKGAFVIGHDVTERRRTQSELTRLLEEERENARLNAALARIDRLVHSTFDRAEALRNAAHEAMRALGGDAVGIAAFGGDAWRLAWQEGLTDEFEREWVLAADSPFSRRLRAASKALVLQDPARTADTPGLVSLLASAGTLIITPVPVRGEVNHAIGVVYRRKHRFSEAETVFATRLAASVGLALANIELYESEREVAETLQQTLVALPSQVPSVVYSDAYQSATLEKGRVGGDFIDIFEAGDNLVGISLGDVSGKGIQAAVITSLVRTTLRVHALDGCSPGAIAEKANNVIRRSTSVESYVTLWFGLLDTATGLLRYIAAGHPPALVVNASGDIRALECTDPIMGAFEDSPYFESQFLFARGDRLVLYSDGATEARSPEGAFLGADGLWGIVSRHADASAADYAGAIMDDVTAFSEGVLRDDAAILVVEPKGAWER